MSRHEKEKSSTLSNKSLTLRFVLVREIFSACRKEDEMGVQQ
jgi:hypothetical protein